MRQSFVPLNIKSLGVEASNVLCGRCPPEQKNNLKTVNQDSIHRLSGMLHLS
jgi:hypothetical protein